MTASYCFWIWPCLLFHCRFRLHAGGNCRLPCGDTCRSTKLTGQTLTEGLQPSIINDHHQRHETWNNILSYCNLLCPNILFKIFYLLYLVVPSRSSASFSLFPCQCATDAQAKHSQRRDTHGVCGAFSCDLRRSAKGRSNRSCRCTWSWANQVMNFYGNVLYSSILHLFDAVNAFSYQKNRARARSIKLSIPAWTAGACHKGRGRGCRGGSKYRHPATRLLNVHHLIRTNWGALQSDASSGVAVSFPFH